MNVYRTPPQQEFKAETEARAAGHVAFVPIEHVWRRSGASRTRAKKFQRPLAPGYVLASGKPENARHIRNQVGTAKPEEVIHMHTQSGQEQPNPYATPKPQPPIAWKAGDTAIVLWGAFKGKTGTVLRVSGRIVVLDLAAASFAQVSLHSSHIGRG